MAQQAGMLVVSQLAVTTIRRVEVRGVTRFFGATAALRGIDADFDAGSITCLRGPNGAGKSTLLAVMGTVLRPSRGQVTYSPLGNCLASVRRAIGWVAHDSLCYRELTARQNVELSARLYGADPKRAWEETSHRVGAETLGERRFGTLSRGQRQRVAVARALVHSPSLLLMDEPWSGLDVIGGERLERILSEEQARGCIVIVVSHVVEPVRRLRAAEVTLERGRIVAVTGPIQADCGVHASSRG